MKAHLAAIPLVLLEQVSALQPQLDVRGDWAEDVFAALRRDHIRAPLDMTEPRLEPLLDDKGAEDEMAISRCRTFLPGFALVWTSGRGDASSFSATRGNQGSPGGAGGEVNLPHNCRPYSVHYVNKRRLALRPRAL